MKVTNEASSPRPVFLEVSPLATLQVESSQPLAEACVTGPFPRHGRGGVAFWSSGHVTRLPLGRILLTLPLLSLLGPLSKTCLAPDLSSSTLEGEVAPQDACPRSRAILKSVLSKK